MFRLIKQVFIALLSFTGSSLDLELPQGYRATTRNFWYSFDGPLRDERLS